MTVEIPLWASVVVGLGSGAVAGGLTLAGVIIKGVFDRRTATDAHEIERTKLNDALFRDGLELARSPDNPAAVDQGYALLGGLAASGRLSTEDAKLVTETVTRLPIRPILEAKKRADLAGEPTELYLTADED